VAAGEATQRRGDCERIGLRAAELLRSRFGDPGEVRAKGDPALAYDVVTEVDVLAEQLVLRGIAEVAPSSLVLGEEGGFERPDGELVDAGAVGDPAQVDELWLVDPLDGTINFAHGIPHFAVSIACWRRGVPVAGAIVDPMVGETFSFEREPDGDAAAFHDGREVRLVDPGGPEHALAYIGSSVRRFPELASRFVGLRQLASAALALAWTGVGRTGAYVQLGGLNAWDWGVGAPFVQAAGGIVTDEGGGAWPAPLDATSGIVAAAPSIHAAVAPLLPGRG
jgi:myo-inositol-1(or 4)-monophosphatase